MRSFISFPAKHRLISPVGIPVHRFDARKMPDVAALPAWLEVG